MKRILSLLLALSCLLALCACGSLRPDPSNGALVNPVYPSMHPQPNQADYATEGTSVTTTTRPGMHGARI